MDLFPGSAELGSDQSARVLQQLPNAHLQVKTDGLPNTIRDKADGSREYEIDPEHGASIKEVSVNAADDLISGIGAEAQRGCKPTAAGCQGRHGG